MVFLLGFIAAKASSVFTPLIGISFANAMPYAIPHATLTPLNEPGPEPNAIP